MTRYKVQILNIVVLVVLILGQTAMPAYAYDIDGSRLKLDAEINSSTAVVHITEESLETFAQNAKAAGYQRLRFAAEVHFDEVDEIVFYVPANFFTCFFEEDFHPDMTFGSQEKAIGISHSRWQELKESTGVGELKITVTEKRMMINRTYAESVCGKVPSEFYETVSLLEPEEELFECFGRQAQAEGRNCVVFDVKTAAGMAENTLIIIKPEWLDYLKDGEQYMTLIFQWDGGETVLRPSNLKNWRQGKWAEEEKLTLMLTKDGCAVFPGQAYPEEVQKVKDAERQAAKQRLIDGVENTTIKLATLRQEGSISLKWKKSAGYRVDYYEVFRSKKKSSGYGVVPFYTTDSAAKTTYKNTKWLHKGWRYYYKVRGVRIIDGEKYYTQWSNKSWRTAL